MALDRASFLKVLEDSYSAYYNIIPDAEAPGLPLIFRADYFSRKEMYFLLKENTIWGNETNDYAYVFSAPAFDRALAARCIDYALEEALPLVKPHKEHQYTNVKVILLADTVTPDVARYVKKRSFTKNYKFSFHGFSTLKSAIVDLNGQKTVTNSAGHELVPYFSKLFAAEKKAKEDSSL